jgi:hypothetical protein
MYTKGINLNHIQLSLVLVLIAIQLKFKKKHVNLIEGPIINQFIPDDLFEDKYLPHG